MRRYPVRFLSFWYDFVVGDDWKLAAGVAIALALDGVLVAATRLSNTAVSLLGVAGIMTVIVASMLGSLLSQRRR